MWERLLNEQKVWRPLIKHWSALQLSQPIWQWTNFDQFPGICHCLFRCSAVYCRRTSKLSKCTKTNIFHLIWIKLKYSTYFSTQCDHLKSAQGASWWQTALFIVPWLSCMSSILHLGTLYSSTLHSPLYTCFLRPRHIALHDISCTIDLFE